MPCSADTRASQSPQGQPGTRAVLPWMQWHEGERVVVRYRLSDGLHDALGTLTEVAVDHVNIETRRGNIRVDADTMVTGKRVPPPPVL